MFFETDASLIRKRVGLSRKGKSRIVYHSSRITSIPKVDSERPTWVDLRGSAIAGRLAKVLVEYTDRCKVATGSCGSFGWGDESDSGGSRGGWCQRCQALSKTDHHPRDNVTRRTSHHTFIRRSYLHRVINKSSKTWARINSEQ